MSDLIQVCKFQDAPLGGSGEASDGGGGATATAASMAAAAAAAVETKAPEDGWVSKKRQEERGNETRGHNLCPQGAGQPSHRGHAGHTGHARSRAAASTHA